jgi:hypothetical protein
MLHYWHGDTTTDAPAVNHATIPCLSFIGGLCGSPSAPLAQSGGRDSQPVEHTRLVLAALHAMLSSAPRYDSPCTAMPLAFRASVGDSSVMLASL